MSVTNLTFIPKFFFTPDIIEKRKPLSANAKKAGWVGYNILYQKIPEQCKLLIIRDGKESAVAEVLRRYEQVKQLQMDNLNLRSWMLDVLNCINDIVSEVFTLQLGLSIRRSAEGETQFESQRRGKNPSAITILARPRLCEIYRAGRLFMQAAAPN